MSRWTLNLPRVVLAVILLAITSLGVAPAVRWALTESLQQSTGGDFVVQDVQTDIPKGIVQLRHAEVTAPNDPTLKMVEVEQAKFTFDPWALACRRLVITEGELQGVHINADIGVANCVRKSTQSELANEASMFGQAWRRALSEPATTTPEMQGLTQVQRIKQLRLTDYQKVIQGVADWQAQFDELDELIRIVGDNPLRMTAAYRARLEELAMVGEHIDALNEELAALQRKVQDDRISLVSLQQADLESLKASTSLEYVSGDRLSNYLLEDEWSMRLGGWINWLHASRELMNIHPHREKFAWTNSRGVDVLFNVGGQPDFSVDNLYVDGTGKVNGQMFRFRGTLNNVSDEPSLAAQPTILTLAADGNGAIQMDAVLDRSQTAPVDRIRVLCPALPMPRRQWGDPREFAIDASESSMRMTMVLSVVGEELTGQVEFSQSGTTLTPSWPDAAADEAVSQMAQVALKDVREVSGSIELSGTLDHPVWQLRSDLGQKVANCMREVTKGELEQRTLRLVTEYRQQSDKEISELVAALQQQERVASDQLASKSQELERFRSRISQRADLMDRLVRNAGPLQNLLR